MHASKGFLQIHSDAEKLLRDAQKNRRRRVRRSSSASIVAGSLPRCKGHAAFADISSRGEHRIVADHRLSGPTAYGQDVVSVLVNYNVVAEELVLVPVEIRTNIPSITVVQPHAHVRVQIRIVMAIVAFEVVLCSAA
jgi:hypothetical protein